MKSFFLNLALFIYIVSFIGSLFYLKTLDKKALRLTHGVLFSGLIFHFFYILIIVKEVYNTSQFTFSEILGFFSFLLILVYFYFALGKEKAYTLATFFLPIPILLILITHFFLKNLSFHPFLPLLKAFGFPCM